MCDSVIELPERTLVCMNTPDTFQPTQNLKFKPDTYLSEFKVVTHIPQLTPQEQPTVALITLLYCEKLAVDAMMEFKTTYIRIKKKEGKQRVRLSVCLSVGLSVCRLSV